MTLCLTASLSLILQLMPLAQMHLNARNNRNSECKRVRMGWLLEYGGLLIVSVGLNPHDRPRPSGITTLLSDRDN